VRRGELYQCLTEMMSVPADISIGGFPTIFIAAWDTLEKCMEDAYGAAGEEVFNWNYEMPAWDEMVVMHDWKVR